MNAVIYTRVSTKEQVEDGNSLVVQAKQCRAYAISEKYKVLRTFQEEGESEKTANRTQLQALLKYCSLNKDKIDIILIARIDRLSRDRMDYGQLKAFFGGLGIKVVSVSERFEDDPVGRFIENTLAGVAQLDNEIRASRSKDGMIEAVENGRWVWKAPFGYVNIKVGDKKNIAPRSPELSSKIRSAWVMIDTGLQPAEVHRRLIADGLVNENGIPISTQTFSKMLYNPLYKGVVRAFSKEVVSDTIKHIVEPELWDRVHEKLTGKNTKPKTYRKLNPEFPLREILRCNRGHKMRGSASTGNGGRYPKYHCTECVGMGFCYDKNATEENFVAYINRYNYSEGVKDALRVAIELTVEEREKSSKKQVRMLEKRLLELESQEVQIAEKNLKGIYKDEVASRLLKKNEADQKATTSNLAELQLAIYDTEDILDFGLNKLTGIGYTWQEIEDIYIKVRFQKWLFPVGLQYDGQNFRTTQMPLCVSIKRDLSEEKSLLVIPRGIEPRLPG